MKSFLFKLGRRIVELFRFKIKLYNPFLHIVYFFKEDYIYQLMAEWGKGDPRWIVEERPDGK